MSEPTIDIPIWDNQIKFLTDSFAEPQLTNTVLSPTEAAAKAELARVLPTLIGREMGIAKIEKVVDTKTRQRVLVVNREQAIQLIKQLETLAK